MNNVIDKIAFTSTVVNVANTNRDGSGTTVFLGIIPKGGEFIHKIIAKPLGTNATATIGIITGNNGEDTDNVENNYLIAEKDLPAFTNGNTTNNEVEYLIDKEFPEGHRLYAQVYHDLTGGGDTGWQFIAYCGRGYSLSREEVL